MSNIQNVADISVVIPTYNRCELLNRAISSVLKQTINVREIKEDNIVFNDGFEIENKLAFNNAANVEINFLIWIDTLPIEKLTKLPHDYKDPKIKYDKESIEVLEVKKF